LPPTTDDRLELTFIEALINQICLWGCGGLRTLARERHCSTVSDWVKPVNVKTPSVCHLLAQELPAQNQTYA
jgi:hypothetical protein